MQVLKLMGGAGAALAALSMAVPAEAQRYRGGPRHHRSHDKIDGGSLLLGALLVGGIVALSNSEKKRRERAQAYEADYEAALPEDGGEPVPVEGSAPVPDMPAPYAAEYDGLYDPPAAQDRCASAAETLGQSYARLARVTAVPDYSWNGRSWVVKGKIELSEGYADGDKRSHKFRCALRAGSEPSVTIEGL
jgi:hypothetical protein